MVTLVRVKISTDEVSLPATLPKVDSAFHSPDGVGKMSSMHRRDDALHGCQTVKFDSCNNL